VKKTGHLPDEFKPHFSGGGDPRSVQGDNPEIDNNPVASRVYMIPTHFSLNLHGV
jgi:hypothetical protein